MNKEIIRAINFLFKVVFKISIGLNLTAKECEMLNCPDYYFNFEDDNTVDDLK